MSTKRMMRWIIVLFLLATLPGLTGVMAQGQEPAVKQAPVVTEPGESQAPEAWNKSESEPNNTCATADPVSPGDVIRGEISSNGDVDFFKVYTSHYLLADIDARSLTPSSALDSVLCIFGPPEDGPCNDDSDGLDSMAFVTNGWYEGPSCVRVSDWGGTGSSSHDYNLILSNPMLLSASGANLGTGTVAGIPFRAEDILAWSRLNTGEEKWVMFFDGSDVNVTKNLHNVATGHDYNVVNSAILLGYAVNATIPGLGTVTPYDVVRFDGSYGPNTWGTFSWVWRGRDHQLSTTSEKIDALGSWDMHWLPSPFDYAEGYPFSTIGKAVGNNLVLMDEDVGILERWYDLQWGGWSRLLDGSTVSGLGAEDLFAVSSTQNDYTYQLTILGNGTVAGHRVTQKDVFAVCVDPECLTFWHGMWHGPDHGWNYNIDAMEYQFGNW